MRSDGDVHVELCGEHIVVAVFGLGERVAVQGAVLVEALARACAGAHSGGPGRGRGRSRPVRLAPPWGEVALSPRAAFLAAPERVPIWRPRAGSRRSAWPPTRPGSPTCYRASA